MTYVYRVSSKKWKNNEILCTYMLFDSSKLQMGVVVGIEIGVEVMLSHSSEKVDNNANLSVCLYEWCSRNRKTKFTGKMQEIQDNRWNARQTVRVILYFKMFQ